MSAENEPVSALAPFLLGFGPCPSVAPQRAREVHARVEHVDETDVGALRRTSRWALIGGVLYSTVALILLIWMTVFIIDRHLGRAVACGGGYAVWSLILTQAAHERGTNMFERHAERVSSTDAAR